MIFRRASQTSQPLMDKASIATTNTRYGAAITSSDESNQQVEANGNLDEDGLHSPHYSYPPQNVQNRNSYAYIPVSRQGSDEDLAGLNVAFPLEIPTPKQPPYEQNISILTDDLEINIKGYKDIKTRTLIYNILGVVSAGIIFLLGRWMPKIPIYFNSVETSFVDADWVSIKNQFGETERIEIHTTEYGGQYGHIFPNASESLKRFDEDSHNYKKVIVQKVKYIKYRFMTLLLDPLTGGFYQLSLWQDNRWQNPTAYHSGLDSILFKERESVFQTNEIDIPQKSIISLLFNEVLHPFYIFQVFSIILWCFENYYIYASSIFVISVFSIISTLIQTRNNWKQIREMSKFVCDVRVYRQRHWTTISSSELVPGDIYEISDPEFGVFPCDSVLIQGDCIVGESMLTGESIPISKVPISDPQLLQKEFGPSLTSMNSFSPELSKSLLFSGTHIIRVRGGFIPNHIFPDREKDRRAVAMVVRTGFNTAKGSLVRSILFPRPTSFQFYRDSFYFTGVMFLIALVGFAISVWKLLDIGMKTSLIIIRTLDIVTIVVPPALPATMSVGMTFAISRLKTKSIFCIAPSRINICGKIDVVCFDKTGTLTEEGLDVLGAQSLTNRSLNEITEDISALSTQTKDQKISLLHCLATCHSIKVVEDELLGDPLDLKMFESTNWTLEEGGSTHAQSSTADDKRHSTQFIPSMVRPPNQPRFSMDNIQGIPSGFLELGILRSFEFISNLRRMSVIVKKLGSPSTEVYTKGAPEAIAELCNPDSLPLDYYSQLDSYTQQGYRVIACAGKSLDNLPFIKVHKISRENVESNLTFLGFIVFENKLKPETIPAIKILQDAQIRQIMCTGDNHLTAISVAKQCSIIDEHALVFVPKVEADSHQVYWESVNHVQLGLEDDRPVLLDSVLLKPPPAYSHNYALAITGNVFRHILDNSTSGVIDRMLVKAQVYARMSPEEKQELVEMLQRVDYCVSFCGDGANDCGALKAADVGLSLSEAEASIAAPFTSKVQDISCVPLVIREGRAALVTSFSCFKYMGLYSIIQFASIILLYNYGSNLGDYQFLLFDLFVILPVAVAMARTLPHPKLHVKAPTASLVSTKMLVSFIGQCGVQIAFQVIAFFYLINQEWFEVPPYDPEEPNISSQVNTTLFIISSYQYLWGAIVFSVGYPYRKELYTNMPFVLTLGVLLAFMMWCNLGPSQWILDVFELVEIPQGFLLSLLGIAFANLATAYIYEQVISRFIIIAIDFTKYLLRSMFSSSSSSYSNTLKKDSDSGASTPTAVETFKKVNTRGKTSSKHFQLVKAQMDRELIISA